ncbi:MAG: hypothetical protein PHP01_01270 [Phycisphaerae bacterium]|nr:hypothetical protein [Phycisphaerae bacterium]
MELSWLMRFRIAAAIAIGVLLLGLLPWDIVKPDANEVFALLSGNISISDILICAGLAFVAGFLASVVCVPFGAQIGIIAAPAGMGAWALRSAPISMLFQESPAVASRMKVYSALKYEGIVWLGLAVCGFAGAILADRIFRKKAVELPDEIKPFFKIPEFAQIATSVIATIFVANFLINIFAVNVKFADSRLEQVTAQPANLQIAFAVLLGFGVCGFLAKIFLSAKAFWSAIASVAVTYYFTASYIKTGPLTLLSLAWPAVFFQKPIAAVLPIQMVSFACLGSLWGYWLAVRYYIWRMHQS